MSRLRLRMVTDVFYETDDDAPASTGDLLKERLGSVVDDAFQLGTLTDDLPAVVERYSTHIQIGEEIELHPDIRELHAITGSLSCTIERVETEANARIDTLRADLREVERKTVED